MRREAPRLGGFHSLRVMRAVAVVTAREILRDKLLYNGLVLSVLLFGFAFMASTLTSIRPERFLLDFGIVALALSNAVIAILTGAAMLAREFDRRTINVALSRPVEKSTFLAGKFLGLSAVLALNWLLLSGALIGLLAVAGAPPETFGATLAGAVFLVLPMSWVLAAMALLFSTISTTSLSVAFSLGMLVVGLNVSHLRLLAARSEGALGRVLLEAIAALVPNLEYFFYGELLTYGLPVHAGYPLRALLYALAYSALLLSVAGALIQTRETN